MPVPFPVRVGTLNLASGRGRSGRALPASELAAAVRELDVDVLAVQEVDAGQPRSHGLDQAAVLADALGAREWRLAATLEGTPGPSRSWRAAEPPRLRGANSPSDGPVFGIALLSRRPVRRWSVRSLGAGRARLPVRAPHPGTGRPRTWWVPDEPRAVLAAELDGLTVLCTHLSFSPPTALWQLAALRRWAARLPGPLVVAGDLNLPGALPARLLRGAPAVRAATYPAARPRVQLDHLVLRGLAAGAGEARSLAVGDHRVLTAALRPA